ncbi:MAG: ACT domain-containing protein [Candidatus Micrarchaeota archaeon]|nr:ACT domain-containing protein [Candidatus Micrarchaeota archaeon]
MDLKLYKRPVSSLSVTGDRVRVTPGVIAKFSSALSVKMVNIYCISMGEYSVSFFVDDADMEKARDALEDIVSKTSSFGALSILRNLGMVTVTGTEFMNKTGVITKLAGVLNKKNINIISLSTSFDSAVLILKWDDCKKAYETIGRDLRI